MTIDDRSCKGDKMKEENTAVLEIKSIQDGIESNTAVLLNLTERKYAVFPER